MNLVELNNQNGLFLTDKGNIHNYLKFYDAIFSQFRDKEINFFEVGYQYGGSCELWKQYFHHANIKSIDIKKWEPNDERNELKLYNQFIEPTGRVSLDLININDLTEDYFKDFHPDIAIDDGSHALEDQIMFLKIVYPVLNDGGYLIIEDIQNWETDLPEFDKLGLHIFVIDQREVSNIYDDIFIYFMKPDTWNFKPK
jgi:cephalosporin hydroxylase